jgi:L-lactate dehydrogenase complex protein LldG
MNSREFILGSIRNNKPQETASFANMMFSARKSSSGEFMNSVKLVGGEVVYGQDIHELRDWMHERFGDYKKIYSEEESFTNNLAAEKMINPANKNELSELDVALFNGLIGVAENGAIWIECQNHRVLPFIAQHLILILNEENIVPTMHEAYDKLKERELPGFGCFISGPSKTADIEQSLVYGAHGPISLTVILTQKNG